MQGCDDNLYVSCSLASRVKIIFAQEIQFTQYNVEISISPVLDLILNKENITNIILQVKGVDQMFLIVDKKGLKVCL